jgi:4-hydroxy-tetrahydrodipicolinate synthase
MNKLFSGTGVALVTPFKEDKSIDFDALKKLLKHVTAGGVNYLVAMGTTGEAAVLTAEEKTKLITFIKTETAGKTPLVIGIGGNNTAALVKTIEHTNFDGISGILSVAPYYNKPTQVGLYNHYKAIAEASPVPVILYNVPGRTSVNISAETTLRLANELENIMAIKEASGDFAQIMQIIKNKPSGFQVISGDDPLTLPLISVGMEGVISVTANAFPKEFSQMVNFALQAEFQKARELHYKLLDFTESLFLEGNPGGIKAALDIMGICKQNLRNPLAPVSRESYNTIDLKLKEVL